MIEKAMEKVVDKMRANKSAALAALIGADAPYYMFGHPTEINARLVKRTSDPVASKRKFPLVALRLDAVYEVRGDMVQHNLNLAIISSTKEQRNAEERLATTFVPVLIPLYDLFLKSLRGEFLWPEFETPEHTRVDRYFWGTTGKAKHVLSDPTDAIEILNLRVNQRITNC